MVKKVWEAIDGQKVKLGMVAWGVYQLLLIWKPGVGNLVNPDIINTILYTWLGFSVRDAWRKLETSK